MVMKGLDLMLAIILLSC